jgi:hypothetical protein
MGAKRMKLLAVAVMTGLCGLATLGAAADVDPAAQKSADEWLALVDTAKYDDSWSQAHSMFKEKVTKEQWVAGINDLVTRVGKIKSRKLKTATPTKTLPGAPEGDYTVFVYDSAYANLPAAADTLVTAKDKDGAWRVTGYFVQPAAK